MKKILLLVCLALSLNSYEIKMQHTFSKKLMPKQSTFYIYIKVVGKTQESIINKLDEYSKLVNGFTNLDTSSGKFNTYPNFDYIDKKRVQNGYNGNINFVVKTNSTKELNNLISKLTKKSDVDGSELSISSKEWQLDEKDKINVKDSLMIDAMLWAKNYTKTTLSKTLNDSCEVKEINFLKSGNNSFYRTLTTNVNSVKTSVPLPIKKSKKVSINVDFVFECGN